MAPVSKYIIDTSAILTQKADEKYRRKDFSTLWNKIDEMVQGKVIVTCSEIAAEIEDDDIKKWMKARGMQILPIDDEVQKNVREIVTKINKDLIDSKANKSSGDVFLIATARKYGLSVITEESIKSNKKIPFTCQKMDIKCINLLDFMEENGMVF